MKKGKNEARYSDVILRRLKQLSPSGRCPCLHINPTQLEVDIDNNDNRWLLTAHGFHSLRRLLPRPTKVPPVPQATKQRSPNYHGIATEADLQAVAALQLLHASLTPSVLDRW